MWTVARGFLIFLPEIVIGVLVFEILSSRYRVPDFATNRRTILLGSRGGGLQPRRRIMLLERVFVKLCVSLPRQLCHPDRSEAEWRNLLFCLDYPSHRK